MNKNILVQYCDLQEEIKDLRRRIDNLERQINGIKEDGHVVDTVTCGKKGKKPLGVVTVAGFPNIKYSRKKTKLHLNMVQLENAELELLEALGEVEKYIQDINNSRIRQIIRYRFIDNCTWRQVAIRVGGAATEESVRKEFERFINQEDEKR